MLADIYPTLLDLAGVDYDSTDREGKSLLHLEDEDRHIFGYICDGTPIYMVTNGVWKYIYYQQGGTEQLFHLATDPEERLNLVQDIQPEMVKKYDDLKLKMLEKFPSLGEIDQQGKVSLYKNEETLPSEQQVKQVNPFAWRGPIRYNGHW